MKSLKNERKKYFKFDLIKAKSNLVSFVNCSVMKSRSPFFVAVVFSYNSLLDYIYVLIFDSAWSQKMPSILDLLELLFTKSEILAFSLGAFQSSQLKRQQKLNWFMYYSLDCHN